MSAPARSFRQAAEQAWASLSEGRREWPPRASGALTRFRRDGLRIQRPERGHDQFIDAPPLDRRPGQRAQPGAHPLLRAASHGRRPHGPAPDSVVMVDITSPGGAPRRASGGWSDHAR